MRYDEINSIEIGNGPMAHVEKSYDHHVLALFSSSEIRIELREDICCRDTQTTCVATDLSQRNGKLMDLDVRFFGKSWQVLPWHCLHAELCTKPYLGML